MNYRYRLKSYSDIGFSNFCDQFRDEYMELLYNRDSHRSRALIDQYLSEYNCRVDWKLNNHTLIFESEQDFTVFVLKWA